MRGTSLLRCTHAKRARARKYPRRLFRRALPFLSSGAKILDQQAMNVASDMIDGKSFQNSAKSRLKEGIKSLVTSNPIIPQSGSGVRRKRRRQPSRKQSKIIKKRRIADIFA